jgi:hypothetical protein
MLRSLLFSSFVVLQLAFPLVVEAQRCYGEGTSHRPNASVEELIHDLSSDYWPRVWTAELRLESRRAEAVPALIKLTTSTSHVQLRETWDLMYPGAKTFYGHGYVVDYDLGWLSARAGWALENLTFQNFGFSGSVLDRDAMFKADITGKAGKPLQDVVDLKQDPVAQQKLREAASERANNWWKQQGLNWSRQNALIEALTSQDHVRAERAMDWVRNGTTRCAGFNQDFVKTKVMAVTNDKLADEMKEFANWLVEKWNRRKRLVTSMNHETRMPAIELSLDSSAKFPAKSKRRNRKLATVPGNAVRR